jgi:hypothetical protein
MSRLSGVSVQKKWALGATVIVLLTGVTAAVIVAEHTSTTSAANSAVGATNPTPTTTPSPSGPPPLTSEQQLELQRGIGRIREVVPVTAAASRQYPAVSAEARRQPDLCAAAFVRQLFTQDYRVSRNVLLAWVQSESAQSTDLLVVGLTPVDLRSRMAVASNRTASTVRHRYRRGPRSLGDRTPRAARSSTRRRTLASGTARVRRRPPSHRRRAATVRHQLPHDDLDVPACGLNEACRPHPPVPAV